MTEVILYKPNGEQNTFYDILAFKFEKDIYRSCTELFIQLKVPDGLQSDAIARIKLNIDGKTIHDGLIDTVTYNSKYNFKSVKIYSRGFTSLLTQNEMIPGLHTDISLDKIMSMYYTFPNCVKWEQNTDTSNYIYVDDGDSMWDGVANLCYKLNGRYPYIRETNTVQINLPSQDLVLEYNTDDLLSYQTVYDYTKFISHYHMQDIDDSYDKFYLVNSTALSMSIMRHKQIPFDRTYTSNPSQGLNFKSAYSNRGWSRNIAVVNGTPYADLNDMFTLNGIFERKRISAICITGNKNGVTTTFSMYHDNWSS
ncbi:MAG: hypothetical protein IJZ64_03610 [Ruminococcus sp.]|nr:hypothetical protein [Ruminococcus sp.]